MKKTILAIMALIAFTSCNKTKEIKIVEPPKEIVLNVISNIDGSLGEYCSGKNEKIKIIFKKIEDAMLPGIEYKIPIKIIFSSSTDIKAGSGYNRYGPAMNVEFLDKEGKVIEGCFAGMKESYTDLATFIKAGNNREEWLNFTGRYLVTSEDKSFDESKNFINAISKATSVRIKSEIIEEMADPNPNESVTDAANRISGKNSDGSSSGGGDCDDFLNRYEEFVTEYVVIAKKVKNDPKNMSYMTELAQLAEKIKGIDGDFNRCKDDSKVSKKLLELQIKMAKAMQ